MSSSQKEYLCESSKKSAPKAIKNCQVCGDKSSGKHYGVISCDGCRGFFKRSIRRDLRYICKENGTCPIDVSRRNNCQACRLRKCLQVNMKPEAVQHRLSTKGRIKKAGHSYETESCIPPWIRNQTTIMSENLHENAARLLFACVKWARSVPSFVELYLSDQELLLRESWSDLFILSASQWSLQLDEDIFSGSSPGKAPAKLLSSVISRCKDLSIDCLEFACLRSLILFKPETRGLINPFRVQLLQDETQLLLHESTSRKRHHQNQLCQNLRFGQLVLLLPLIRSMTPRIIEDVFFRKIIGSAAVCDLITEIMKFI